MSGRYPGQPSGMLGLKGLSLSGARSGDPAPSLTGSLVERSHVRPWLLSIWEPLDTKAPSPSRCRPFCCYVHTVIFYHWPYIVGPRGGWRDSDGRFHRNEIGLFAEYDRVETRLRWDDVVEFDGELFKVLGGTVIWRRGAWWVHRAARRRSPLADVA